MSKSGIFLDYHGQVDFGVIDSLLIKLRKTSEFTNLSKMAARRTYALFVECLENIAKHSSSKASDETKRQPHVSIRSENDKILITSGNTITNDERDNIEKRLARINRSDEPELRNQFENKISSILLQDEKCAGLGFLTMALKSGNKIEYNFSPILNGYLYFELKISLNKNIMRKLIIDQKSNSPKVVLDPDKKTFLISGESRPPDVREFYGPILDWLEEFGLYLTKLPFKEEPVIFDFNFEYFNSSSGKMILDICKILAGFRSKGTNIIINWHFEKDDYDMLEAGKEISRIVKFPFEYVQTVKN